MCFLCRVGIRYGISYDFTEVNSSIGFRYCRTQNANNHLKISFFFLYLNYLLQKRFKTWCQQFNSKVDHTFCFGQQFSEYVLVWAVFLRITIWLYTHTLMTRGFISSASKSSSSSEMGRISATFSFTTSAAAVSFRTEDDNFDFSESQ